MLEIYSSHKLAQEKLEDEVAYLDKEGISDAKLEIQYCIGPDLLNLLAKVDEIFIDNVAYAITLDASFFEKRNNEIDVPVISANELREILSEH